MSRFEKPIRNYMKAPVHCATVEDSLVDVERQLRERNVSCLPVVGRDGTVTGVISYSDLLQIGHVMARSVGGKQLLNLPAMCVGDLMTPQIVATPPDATVASACGTMCERNIHRLFVLEGSKAVGVFSARDAMTAIVEAKLKEPIARYMTAPAITVDAATPVSIAAERLYGSRVTGVIVTEDGAPGGLFTQIEALAARELPQTTPVGEAVGYSVICLPESTPIDRAAGFAIHGRARRVVVLGREGIAGVLTPLDFARAATSAD